MDSGLLWREVVTKIHKEYYSDMQLDHVPVSYTHLDVYKRQPVQCTSRAPRRIFSSQRQRAVNRNARTVLGGSAQVREPDAWS